jgi:hypothetical protein
MLAVLSWDQIERELKAIEAFDRRLMAEPSCRLEDVVGYAVRLARRRELAKMAQRIAETN